MVCNDFPLSLFFLIFPSPSVPWNEIAFAQGLEKGSASAVFNCISSGPVPCWRSFVLSLRVKAASSQVHYRFAIRAKDVHADRVATQNAFTLFF
jgi:hypothetical protein